MAFPSPPKTWSVGEIVTAAYMNAQLRDALAYLKGQAGDVYIEDDLGVGTSAPLTNVPASTYGRGITTSSANSNEINALIAEGHRSGSDSGFGHFCYINRAATGTDKRGVILAGIRDTDDNSAKFAVQTRNAGTISTKFSVMRDGKVGANVSTPQGQIHGHDGFAGFLHWSNSAVSGSAVSIIPDGTGDVITYLAAQYLTICSTNGNVVAGASTGGSALAPGGGGLSIGYDNQATPTQICTLTVNADGSVQVRRTTGATATFKVVVWLLWI